VFQTEKNKVIVIISGYGQTVVDILTAARVVERQGDMSGKESSDREEVVRLRTTTKVLNCAQTTETCVSLADEAHLKYMEHGKGSP
jgi:hypothetical protein